MKAMTKAELLSHMKRLEACEEATRWVRAQRGATPAQMWRSCPDHRWLNWLATLGGVSRRAGTRANRASWREHDREWIRTGVYRASLRAGSVASVKRLPWTTVARALRKQAKEAW